MIESMNTSAIVIGYVVMAVSVPVYAIGRGGYIQHDTNTGQLEIYETEALARVNARDGDIVRAVNVNQVYEQDDE